MNDAERLLMLHRAVKRRALLVLAGCSTYHVGLDHHGEARSITCLCCGRQSHNPHDIFSLYCQFCSAYHAEWIAA